MARYRRTGNTNMDGNPQKLHLWKVLFTLQVAPLKGHFFLQKFSVYYVTLVRGLVLLLLSVSFLNLISYICFLSSWCLLSPEG